MKQAYLVAEGDSGVEILKKFLPRAITRSIEFVAGSNDYYALSKAGAILAVKHLPVALVINTYTLNESTIQEQVDSLRYLLRQAAAGVRFEIFPAVPEIESVFFQDRRFIEKLAKKTFTDMEWNFAKLNPKEALAYLLGNSAPLNSKILHRLTDETIRVLQQHSLIARLSEFLSSVLESNKFAKAA